MTFQSPNANDSIQRRGAVAVIVRRRRLLVIQRSQFVRAPGAYCFPGGGIEPGESESQALCREMMEELAAPVRPVRRLWQSVTRRQTELVWWLAELDDPHCLAPNPAEVAAVQWNTIDEIRRLPGVLESNLEFLDAMQRGEFSIAMP